MIWVLAIILGLAYSGLSTAFGMDKIIDRSAFGVSQSVFTLFVKIPIDGLSLYLLAKWIIGFF